MVNKNRLALWVVSVIWRAFWVFIIGGTISFLLARTGDGLAALITIAITLALVIGYVISRTVTLARAFDRASTR